MCKAGTIRACFPEVYTPLTHFSRDDTGRGSHAIHELLPHVLRNKQSEGQPANDGKII